LSVAIWLQTGGYRTALRLPQPGSLAIAWYAGHAPAALTAETVVVAGRTRVQRAGRVTLTLRPTPRGSSLIQRRRSLRVTAVGTFTPSNQSAVAARATFTLG
jgi:hypothetical protein